MLWVTNPLCDPNPTRPSSDLKGETQPREGTITLNETAPPLPSALWFLACEGDPPNRGDRTPARVLFGERKRDDRHIALGCEGDPPAQAIIPPTAIHSHSRPRLNRMTCAPVAAHLVDGLGRCTA